MLMWKFVGAPKASILYVYIDNIDIDYSKFWTFGPLKNAFWAHFEFF